MGASGVGAMEPPFVGQERYELVDRLLADYDEVSRSGTPRWWSLEAHSGWGKTRIVQEFYRRLAAERQSGERYWPPSLNPVDPPVKSGPSTSMRKRVYPEQVVTQLNAVPQWFWWGISCATRSGTPVQALADDMTQFVEHKVGLEQRWRLLASPRARLVTGLSSKKGELVETATGEALGVASGMANLAFPGLGLLVLTAKWGAQGLRAGRLAAQAAPVVDAAGRGRSDLVDELAPALERLAAAGMPIVIVIEDLHLADESLVELLARLLAAREARILVISTAWRGLLNEDNRAAHGLIGRIQPDRLRRVLADDDLRDLAPSEREEIVRATLPEVSDGNAKMLAASYTNPWALQLASNVGWVHRAERELTAAEVARLPRDIDGLFTQLWNELPEETRKALMVAALGTPMGISDSMGFGDARWDSSLLSSVSDTEAWLRASVGDLSAVLGKTSDAYGWVRSVDEWLRRFHDPGQHDVAVGQAKVEFDDGERRALYEAMARRMSADAAESPSQELHHARLLVALASEGFLTWDGTTLAAAVKLCDSLLDLPDVDSRRCVILITEAALRSATSEAPVAGPLLSLRALCGIALDESGRVAEAITTFERLLRDRTRVLGPDAADTLTTRGWLASLLGQSGRLTEAVTASEQLLEDQARVLGSDHPHALGTRNNLASWLGESGRVTEAVTALEQLLEDQARVLGPDHPDTLGTRNNLAYWLGESGRVTEAITASEQLLADRTRVLGPDHPDSLDTRNNLAYLLGESGRVTEAITAFEQLLADRIRVSGPDHPATLTARNNLAESLSESGRVTEAITAFEQLLEDQGRLLGPDHPDTQTTRHNQAAGLGRAGRVADAITAFEQLLADRTRVLGPDAPDTLTARNNLAYLLGESGQLAEQVTAFEQLRKDQTRVLGRDHPDTLRTRQNLAASLGESGQVDEAVTAFQRLLTDRTRVFGAHHLETLTTLNSLAAWLGRSGRVAKAITAYEQLLKDQTQVLGPNHPDTLTTRSTLATMLGRSGRVFEAIIAFRRVLADQSRLLGPAHPATLTTGNNLAILLADAGQAPEAITSLEQLLVVRLRVFGADHPDTLTARSNLADSLGKAGRVSAAVTAFEQLLKDRSRVLGPNHPDTLAARDNLRFWLEQS